MNILVIAAHPDDEVLGCGGTIARLAQINAVYVAILGEGETSRGYKKHDKSDITALNHLIEASQKAANILGIEELMMFKLPDNQFDTLPLLDIVKVIEEMIDKIEPTVIFTHHGGDLNIDHAITFRATITAARPLEDTPVKTIYSFEVPSSTEWALGKTGNFFNPNCFFDISATLEQKIEAMSVYESESRPFPHPRSSESLRALAAWRGSTAGLKAAEAFELIRDIRL